MSEARCGIMSGGVIYYHLYLRNGTVFVPTMGQMDKGFYRDVEPVAIVPVRNIEALRQALAAMIARANPKVPMLRRSDWPQPVVLKHAGVKSWSAFERGMLLWGLKEKDGAFEIIGKRKKPDGTRMDDPEQVITFPSGSTVDRMVDRMTAILQD